MQHLLRSNEKQQWETASKGLDVDSEQYLELWKLAPEVASLCLSCKALLVSDFASKSAT